MAYFNLSQIIFLSQVLSIQMEQVVTVLNHHLHLYMAILQFVTKQENCSRLNDRISLNDIIYPGPKLLNDLLKVLGT